MHHIKTECNLTDYRLKFAHVLHKSRELQNAVGKCVIHTAHRLKPY